MSLTQDHQRKLPANRARVEVLAVDGSQLASTTPRQARLLVRTGVARFHRNEAGKRWVQMLRDTGTVVPQVVAPAGTVVPVKG